MVAQNNLAGKRAEFAASIIKHRLARRTSQLAVRNKHRRPRAHFAIVLDRDFIEILADEFRVIKVRRRMTMKPALHHMMQRGGLVPVTLIVRIENLVGLIDRDASRRTHAHRERHKFPLRRNLKGPPPVLCRAAHLGIVHASLVPFVAARPTRPTEGGVQRAIEITFRITHRTKGIFVIIIREPPSGVHGLIQVSHTVLVGVHQLGQLGALHHIHVLAFRINPKAQRFVQTIGVQLPLAVGSVEFPNLAFARANEKRGVIQKCHTANTKRDAFRDEDGVHLIPGGLDHRTRRRHGTGQREG